MDLFDGKAKEEPNFFRRPTMILKQPEVQLIIETENHCQHEN